MPERGQKPLRVSSSSCFKCSTGVGASIVVVGDKRTFSYREVFSMFPVFVFGILDRTRRHELGVKTVAGGPEDLWLSAYAGRWNQEIAGGPSSHIKLIFQHSFERQFNSII